MTEGKASATAQASAKNKYRDPSPFDFAQGQDDDGWAAFRVMNSWLRSG
jgi:hypothetical protein